MPSQLVRTIAVNGLAAGACAHAGVTAAITATAQTHVEYLESSFIFPQEKTLCVSVPLCLCD